ncbi:MAG: histidine kinase [Bacteroidales bacterium]|jgi:sensor histidine kinase YesM|nr:histidine kinase [Bacteroidales bacterium]
MKINKTEILIHAVSWIILILFFTVTPVLLNTRVSFDKMGIIRSVSNSLVNVTIFYMYYIFVMTPALKKRSFLIFVLYSVLMLIAVIILKMVIGEIMFGIYNQRIIGPVFKDMDLIPHIISNIFYCGMFAFLGVVTRFIVEWFKNEKLKNNLEKQNLKSELALLRSQVNPHFLFNTLNNIYSLVYKKSDKAPESVLKLSGIMRYMLYESNEDYVNISKELEYLNNYIELQKIRYANPDKINYNITGENTDAQIAPMIFIPFIENSFKHGPKEDVININIDITATNITFEIFNKISEIKTISKDRCGGIGLRNVARRLELLYKDRHKLSINGTDNSYSVKLILDL